LSPTWSSWSPTWSSLSPTWSSWSPTWSSLSPTWSSWSPTWSSWSPTWSSLSPTWSSWSPTWSSWSPTWSGWSPPRSRWSISLRGWILLRAESVLGQLHPGICSCWRLGRAASSKSQLCSGAEICRAANNVMRGESCIVNPPISLVFMYQSNTVLLLAAPSFITWPLRHSINHL
jgi:hypothetical protein